MRAPAGAFGFAAPQRPSTGIVPEQAVGPRCRGKHTPLAVPAPRVALLLRHRRRRVWLTDKQVFRIRLRSGQALLRRVRVFLTYYASDSRNSIIG